MSNDTLKRRWRLSETEWQTGGEVVGADVLWQQTAKRWRVVVWFRGVVAGFSRPSAVAGKRLAERWLSRHGARKAPR